MRQAQIMALLIVAPFLLFTTDSAAALQPTAPAAQSGPDDPKEVESYLDQLFLQQMKDYHFAGITAIVVKDGQVLFQKGYGYADIENKEPVDPANTMFRIGSVTKLFTWTAILQLYEQGKLELDVDINRYLDFQIPDTFSEPITLKDLLSHTPGFEFLWYESCTSTPYQLLPLRDLLTTHMPARIYQPGKVSVYSNYGTQLAGYIIERVSGMSYADYIEANILKPLGMAQTTSRQPLPADFSELLSKGYVYSNNDYQIKEFQLISGQPEGSISSTAADMARFMTAHLQDGSLCDAAECGSILKPATEQLMQTSLWGPAPGISGFTYGFMEWNFNGQRILYHPGDTLVFQSNLMLLPEQGLGFFYSYNTANPGVVPWDTTMLAFMQHYYPVATPASQPAPDFSSRAQVYSGNYFLARSSHTTLEKVNRLNPSMWVQITDSGDGALLLGSPLSPVKVRLEEIEPGLFRETTSSLQFVFHVDDRGEVFLYDTHQPEAPFVQVPWHANPMLYYDLLIACGLIFLSALLAGIISGAATLFKKGIEDPHPTLSRLARWTAIIVALLDLAGLFAFLVLMLGGDFVDMIGYGEIGRILIVLTIWLAAAVLTIGLVGLTILVWRKGIWSTLVRIHFTLVTLAALAFTWFLGYWNLLGYRF